MRRILEGEYGVRGLYTGVPARLGAGGLVEVIEVALSEADRAALHCSAASVQQLVELMDSGRADIDPSMPALGEVVAVG